MISSASLQLRPVETDVDSTLSSAVRQRTVTDQIAAAARARGVDTVMFVGVGGSWASSVPVSLSLSAVDGHAVYNLNAAEFAHTHLKRVDGRTLVVASSHSGGTPETVRAARAAADCGALVVSIARDADNDLAAAAEFALTYGSEHTVTSAKYTLLEELSCSLQASIGADVSVVRDALDRMPTVVPDVVSGFEQTSSEAVERIAKSDNIFVLGTGRLLGLSYMLSVCYLVEQQWRVSTHFNSADFFHGPFELIQDGTSVIHLASADETAPLSRRVDSFLDRYCSNWYTIDAASLDLPGVPDAGFGQVAHIAMAEVVSRVAYHFEPVTGHSLDTRRYMHKVAY